MTNFAIITMKNVVAIKVNSLNDQYIKNKTWYYFCYQEYGLQFVIKYGLKILKDYIIDLIFLEYFQFCSIFHQA